jgi:hypothetical protein
MVLPITLLSQIQNECSARPESRNLSMSPSSPRACCACGDDDTNRDGVQHEHASASPFRPTTHDVAPVQRGRSVPAGSRKTVDERSGLLHHVIAVAEAIAYDLGRARQIRAEAIGLGAATLRATPHTTRCWAEGTPRGELISWSTDGATALISRTGASTIIEQGVADIAQSSSAPRSTCSRAPATPPGRTRLAMPSRRSSGGPRRLARFVTSAAERLLLARIAVFSSRAPDYSWNIERLARVSRYTRNIDPETWHTAWFCAVSPIGTNRNCSQQLKARRSGPGNLPQTRTRDRTLARALLLRGCIDHQAQLVIACRSTARSAMAPRSVPTFAQMRSRMR